MQNNLGLSNASNHFSIFTTSLELSDYKLWDRTSNQAVRNVLWNNSLETREKKHPGHVALASTKVWSTDVAAAEFSAPQGHDILAYFGPTHLNTPPPDRDAT